MNEVDLKKQLSVIKSLKPFSDSFQGCLLRDWTIIIENAAKFSTATLYPGSHDDRPLANLQIVPSSSSTPSSSSAAGQLTIPTAKAKATAGKRKTASASAPKKAAKKDTEPVVSTSKAAAFFAA